jgi:spore coat polysaccharide biosynthesis protein SpsF
MKHSSETENFWLGEFGNDYISRNIDNDLLSSNFHFFSTVLAKLNYKPKSILELGANVGMNIVPLMKLFPKAQITGVDINTKACKELAKTGCKVINSSINELVLDSEYDLVFTKTVLIHIDPVELESVYKKMYQSSKKYILIAEYYSTTPTNVEYRGFSNKLFKRDFGFSYHRSVFSQDDLTWFVLEKI